MASNFDDIFVKLKKIITIIMAYILKLIKEE